MSKIVLELTEREKEVADLLASGMRYKDIGTKLSISHTTVKCHARNIYQKLGFKGPIGEKLSRKKLIQFMYGDDGFLKALHT